MCWDEDAIGVVGADAAETGLPHQNYVRPEFAKIGEVDAPAVEDVAAEVGHEYVADLDQLLEDLEASGGSDVDGYALLGALEVGLACPAGPGGYEGHLVEYLVGLDLDDLGAQGGEDSPGQWEGYVRPQFQNTYVLEGFLVHVTSYDVAQIMRKK